MAPVTNYTAEDLENMENDKRAMRILISAISPDIFPYIQDCISAKEIWDTLADIFEGSDKAEVDLKISALNEFHNFLMLPGENLEAAFNRFNLIVTKLGNTGITKLPFQVNRRFLDGLGDKWVIVKLMVQETRNIGEYSLYDLYSEIQVHESTVMLIASKLMCINHYAKRRFSKTIKDAAYYLHEMQVAELKEKMQVAELKEKEKEKAFEARARVEVWSSGSEEEDEEEDTRIAGSTNVGPSLSS